MPRGGPRAPRYRSRHCKFPTCPTRISQLSHRIQRDPRLYIIYSYFHAPAGFYRETRYSFRIPFSYSLSSSLAHRSSLFFPFFFILVFFFPRTLLSWYDHFLLPARKTPFAEDPVSWESVVVSDNGTARVCLFFPFFLALSFSFFVMPSKSIAFSANNREGCWAHSNCLHKQLAEFWS